MTATVLVRPTDGGTGPTLRVRSGPRLLADLDDGPGLDRHRDRVGALRTPRLARLLRSLDALGIRGRGGAGFPFATKLRTAAGARGRPTVVVNFSEGEPASFKDAALAATRPHLVLDGASLTAGALGAREVHLVLPGERPAVRRSIRTALAERRGEDRRLRWRLHTADPRFVAGQARAVVELLSGRPNLPVTGWQPEAVCGYRGRPTLLSNAETFAQVAAAVALGEDGYAWLGTADEPGSLLLTVGGDGSRPEVLEAAHGTAWSAVLPAGLLDRPVLLGGYHGTWAAPGALTGLTVSRPGLAEAGLALGAGVVLPLADGACPLTRTAGIAGYLAGQSAQRCGPCLNGLPALAAAVRSTALGRPATGRVTQLADLVERRGACAHPDGTVRLVRSLLAAYPDEVAAHADGCCTFGAALPGEEVAS
ncbi:MAG: NADH-ubiquinone oxidoreductase-F iron-sulfur binding region domain-containing protein [Nocardioidaceae bacterium]